MKLNCNGPTWPPVVVNLLPKEKPENNRISVSRSTQVARRLPRITRPAVARLLRPHHLRLLLRPHHLRLLDSSTTW
jgi:hypothetical protein